MEHIEKVFEALGADKRTIEKIKAPSEDFNPEEVANLLRQKQIEYYQNSSDYQKAITQKASEEAKKAQNIAMQKLRKAAGLQGTTIEADDLDGFFAKSVELIKGGQKQTQEAWEKERLELLSRLEDYETNKIPALKAEAEKQVRQIKMDLVLGQKVASLPLAELGDKGLQTKAILQILKSEYQLDYDDATGAIIPKDANGQRIPIAGKSSYKELSDVLTELADKMGYLRKNPGVTGVAQKGLSTTQPASIPLTPKQAYVQRQLEKARQMTGR
jgi:hypothetical protein